MFSTQSKMHVSARVQLYEHLESLRASSDIEKNEDWERYIYQYQKKYVDFFSDPRFQRFHNVFTATEWQIDPTITFDMYMEQQKRIANILFELPQAESLYKAGVMVFERNHYVD